MRRQAGGRGLSFGSGDADYAHRPCRIAVECRRAVCQRRAAVRNPDDGGVPGQGGERLLDNESPRALPISCGCEVVPVAPHSAQAEEQAVRSGGAGITADRADGSIQQPFPVALRGGCQQVRGRQSVYQFAQRAGHERTASVCAAPCAGCSAGARRAGDQCQQFATLLRSGGKVTQGAHTQPVIQRAQRHGAVARIQDQTEGQPLPEPPAHHLVTAKQSARQTPGGGGIHCCSQQDGDGGIVQPGGLHRRYLLLRARAVCRALCFSAYYTTQSGACHRFGRKFMRFLPIPAKNAAPPPVSASPAPAHRPYR